MMAVVGGIIIVLGFVVFTKVFGLVERSTKVINMAKSATTIVRDTNLDDYQKEIAMKKHTKELFSLFFLITTGSIAALAIPFGFIWLMEFVGLLRMHEVIDATLSLKFIAATVVLSSGFFWLTRKKSGKFSI